MIRGAETTVELASERQIRPALIGQWRRPALENPTGLFERGGAHGESDIESISAPLYQQIGWLKDEIDRQKTTAEGLE